MVALWYITSAVHSFVRKYGHWNEMLSLHTVLAKLFELKRNSDVDFTIRKEMCRDKGECY
jgi:hypothetical protein